MTHISMNNQETVTNKLHLKMTSFNYMVVEVSIHTSLRIKSMNTVNCSFLFSQEKLLNKYPKSERERKDTKKSKGSLAHYAFHITKP